MNILERNRKRDVYLVTTDERIVFIPQGWCDEFEQDPDADEREIYCWLGNSEVLSFQETGEWLTTDAQFWLEASYLETLDEVTEEQARRIDPDLFKLLDFVNREEDSGPVPMETLRLGSTQMCNTPGILKYAQVAYRSNDKAAAVSIFTEGFGLTEPCAIDLLSGKISYRVEDGNVAFEYPVGRGLKPKEISLCEYPEVILKLNKFQMNLIYNALLHVNGGESLGAIMQQLHQDWGKNET